MQLQEQAQDLTVIVNIKQQLQEAHMRIQRMVGVHEKAVAERDEYARQARATAIQLSHQRLTVAHLQRQVDRARRENMVFRAEVRDLSAGRQPQVWLKFSLFIAILHGVFPTRFRPGRHSIAI